MTDVRLGQSGFEERSRDVVLAGGILAGTVVALIVDVNSVGDRPELALVAKALHLSEEFVLAVEAALAIVADVLGIVHFEGRDHVQWNRVFLGEGYGILQVDARKGRRIGDYGKHLVAEHAMSFPSEVGGIDSARIGDQQRRKLTQLLV